MGYLNLPGMKIKTVIFDLDGTIANTLPLCIAAFRKSVEPYLNAGLSDEDIIATFAHQRKELSAN